MGFRSSKSRQQSKMPELNLLPMMDVVLTILMFFILVAMVLKSGASQSASVDIDVPSAKEGLNSPSPAANKTPVEPLIISVDAKGAFYSGSKSIERSQLKQEMQTYLAQHPQQGVVALNADSKLSYAKIIEVLSEMRAIGGGKVSLAVSKAP
jgi:biopolymer transport protein ExbD